MWLAWLIDSGQIVVSWLAFCRIQKGCCRPVIYGDFDNSDRPFGVLSGFSISNFKLGCALFVML